MWAGARVSIRIRIKVRVRLRVRFRLGWFCPFLLMLLFSESTEILDARRNYAMSQVDNLATLESLDEVRIAFYW